MGKYCHRPGKVPVETPAAQEPFFAKVDLSPEPHTASGINIKFRDTPVNSGIRKIKMPESMLRSLKFQ